VQLFQNFILDIIALKKIIGVVVKAKASPADNRPGAKLSAV
jgi:hypothetical protein